MSQKTISILTACYNEEANVLSLYNQVREVMAGIGSSEYKHIFIDNASQDNTVAILKPIAPQDEREDHRERAQLRPHPLAESCALPGRAETRSSASLPIWGKSRR